MRVHVLRNPVGGNGSTRRAAAEAVGRLRGAGHDVVELTGDSRDASETGLRAAVQTGQIERLVVAGGDGLVHLAIQHLAKTDVPMLIAPTGTGNDFATALGVAKDINIEQALLATPTLVDLIHVTSAQATEPQRGASTGSIEKNGVENEARATEPRSGASTGSIEKNSVENEARATEPRSGASTVSVENYDVERYIASIAIAGFPADINARANGMSLPIGRQVYTVAAALELPKFDRLQLDLVVDGERLELDSAMLAIGNTSLFGGGMLACPDADATDGKLHLTSIEGVGRVGILGHLQGRAGGTADRPEVVRRIATHVEIETPGIEIWGDGEPIAISPVALRIVPEAIKIAGLPAD